jgi:hypothetical protein
MKENNLETWNRTHPSDEEIQKMVDADPDAAPILTREELDAKSFVRMPKPKNAKKDREPLPRVRRRD